MICSLGSIYIHYAYNCVLLLLSRFSRVRLCATPWTAAYQVPPSMGFFQARVLEWVAIAFSFNCIVIHQFNLLLWGKNTI